MDMQEAYKLYQAHIISYETLLKSQGLWQQRLQAFEILELQNKVAQSKN